MIDIFLYLLFKYQNIKISKYQNTLNLKKSVNIFNIKIHLLLSW